MQLPTVNLFVLVVILICWTHGEASPTNFIVATDGSGNFRRISDAIMAAPNDSSLKFYIRIKAGLYKENIIVGPKKKNLVLIGDGRDTTIISGHRSAAGGFKLIDTATVAIYADGFVARDITFKNVAGPNKFQAAALETQANYLNFFRCRFLGYQDTLYAREGYQFFKECEIRGMVDFICGNAAVIFQSCTIYVRKPLSGQSNTITAQKKSLPQEKTGTVIQNSIISASKQLRHAKPRAKTYLGRPWGPFARTVIMNSFLDKIIDRAGWLEWNNRGGDPVFYAEYHNTGPGANTKSRVKWAKIINSTKVIQFTVKNFIKGDKWIPGTFHLPLISCKVIVQ